jgi:hypothetical protein
MDLAEGRAIREKDLGGGVGLSIGSLYLRDFR